VAVRPRRISDIKPLFTNLAQTSHYEVKFGTMPPELQTYLLRKGVSSRFIAEDAGLLCYSAVLPTTSLMTANISGNFTGITENFAHTRQYDSISLDFYVDKNYQTLKFLECWMEFIASGSTNPIGLTDENAPISTNVNNYFIRMQYPEYYKANSVKIIKFDRDYNREIEYNFRGLFPSSISSIQVSYISSDTLKMSATFQYDRYIAGRATSLSQLVGDNNNINPNNPQASQSNINSIQSLDDINKKIIDSQKQVFNTDYSKVFSTSPSSSNQSNQTTSGDWWRTL
jgi:hypothetical protein